MGRAYWSACYESTPLDGGQGVVKTNSDILRIPVGDAAWVAPSREALFEYLHEHNQEPDLVRVALVIEEGA